VQVFCLQGIPVLNQWHGESATLSSRKYDPTSNYSILTTISDKLDHEETPSNGMITCILTLTARKGTSASFAITIVTPLRAIIMQTRTCVMDRK